MAKTSFFYACGHKGTTGGDNRRRSDSRAEWLSQQMCRDCSWAAEQEAAVKAAEASGLPALTGASPKQIAYGETMRARHLAALPAKLDELRAAGAGWNLRLDAAEQAQLDDAITLIAAELRGQTEAKDWIEYPDDVVAWAMQQIVTRHLAPSALAVATLEDKSDADRAFAWLKASDPDGFAVANDRKATPAPGTSAHAIRQDGVAATRIRYAVDRADPDSGRPAYVKPGDLARVRAVLDRASSPAEG